MDCILWIILRVYFGVYGGDGSRCIEDNPVEPEPVRTEATVRQAVIDTAWQYVGLRELTGKNDGPEIDKFLDSAGVGRNLAWCVAFACYVYKVNMLLTPSGCAWTPSWFPLSKLVAYEEVQPGDMLSLWSTKLKREYHGEIFHSHSGTNTRSIGGNTGPTGSIGGFDVDGDGVYFKLRPRSTIHSFSNWISPQFP
jgi:hypothetical protein